MRPFSPRSAPPLRLPDTLIETARLRLTPTTEADAEVIFRSFTAEVTRYMFPKPAERLEETFWF